jgi:hypothetical protein
MVIYGNAGSISKALDNIGSRTATDAQALITNRYMHEAIDIVPNVVKDRFPSKGRNLTEMPNPIRRFFTKPHIFLCTGAMPLPDITPVDFHKFREVHKQMTETYLNDPRRLTAVRKFHVKCTCKWILINNTRKSHTYARLRILQFMPLSRKNQTCTRSGTIWR